VCSVVLRTSRSSGRQLVEPSGMPARQTGVTATSGGPASGHTIGRTCNPLRISTEPQWPIYDSTPLYERSSLDRLESDIRIVSQTWFRHDRHESIENFVCALPLAYFEFDTHDRYAESTHYEMDTLFRVFLLKRAHEWAHGTALIEYLVPSSTLRPTESGDSTGPINAVAQLAQPVYYRVSQYSRDSRAHHPY